MIPINYQHHLTALVYRLLAASDPEYASFLHEQGYAPEGERKRFKLFVFSWLRPRNRRAFQAEGEWLRLGPGAIEWFVSSPRTDFLTHSATGLLSVGTAIRVEGAAFRIAEVCALPVPTFGPSARFTCLSPIVAAVSGEAGETRYLRPWEGAAFSEAVRRNLLQKYELLYGGPPEETELELTFDAGYLERDRHRGTKKITYKEVEVVGALAPLTLRGSAALMQVGWECGLGEKNSAGFGMVELRGAA